MKIAWLGLGNMGRVMAERVLAAGHELTVFNRTRERAQSLLDGGARWAETPASAVAEAELIVTMLADDAALRGMLEGGGALAAMKAGSVHVSMSTIGVELARELTASHATRQVHFVGAPVFGRPDAAAAGKLFIVAGGEPAAVARCQPLFEALGQKVLPLGPKAEDAHLTKVLGNFLLLASVELLGEALNVASASGLEPKAVLEALTSSVFTAPFYASYGRLIVAQNFDGPAAFSVALAKKDLELALTAAAQAGTALPLAEPVRAKLSQLLADGDGNKDATALGRFEEKGR